MALARTDRAALLAHLEALGLHAGMDLTVHSKLLSFGRLDGGPEMVIAAIRSLVGASATLVFPTYTFDTGETVYDPESSVSTKVGLLGEWARAQPGAVRSRSPIHNHVALGPRAAVLAASPGDGSLGPGTDFEILQQAGFHLLLLGCRFDEGCTHLHHVEAMVGVPYRAWIDLDRHVRDPESGAITRIACRYYGRVAGAPETHFDAIVPALREAAALSEAAAPYGRSYRVALADLDRVARRMLVADPWALVRRVSS